MNRHTVSRPFLMVGSHVLTWIGLALIGSAPLHAAGSYRIKAEIDPDGLFMTATAHVVFENDGKYPLDRLLVDYQGEAIAGRDRISLETPEGTQLELIPTDERGLNTSRQFLVRLPQALGPGESMEFKFLFNQVDPEGMWYPHVHPGHPVAYAFRVHLLAPAGRLYMSPGALVRREQIDETMEAIEFESAPVSHFALRALPSEDWHEIMKYAGNVQVRGFWKDSHWEKWIRLFVDIACDVIEFYREEFGFYPATSRVCVSCRAK